MTTGPKLPIAAEFTDAKRAKQETAMRVTCDALAVKQPIWIVGDGAYDLLEWHDPCFQQVVVLLEQVVGSIAHHPDRLLDGDARHA